MKERVKLSQFAKNQGITYQSAWKMWDRGEIEGIKLDSGTILVSGWAKSETQKPRAVIYARVNDPKHSELLKKQVSDAESYCEDRNYEVVGIVSEVVQGVNFNRPKLVELLQRENWDTLIIEDERILTSFGFSMIKAALGARTIEVLNEVEVNDNLTAELFAKVISWSKQFVGMGAQKRSIFEVMNKMNY